MQDNDIDGSGKAASAGVAAPQTVADVLDAAADLLEKPGAWTQGEFARGVGGRPLAMGYYPKAVCWCVGGALEKVLGCKAEVLVAPYWEAIEKTLPAGMNLTGWNDDPSRTQSEVVAALRAAATSARQGENHVR